MAPSTMATTPEALATEAPIRKGSMVTSAVSRSVSPCRKKNRSGSIPRSSRRMSADSAAASPLVRARITAPVRRRCDAARCRYDAGSSVGNRTL